MATGLGTLCGLYCGGGAVQQASAAAPASGTKGPFSISLAEWSLVKTLRSGKMTNLDFPAVARKKFGIHCIEFVDQFFADKARDKAYLKELKNRASSEGVSMGLIMIDTTGPLGVADKKKRQDAVEKTFAWIDAARFLGCHTVRVNAWGEKDPDSLKKCVSESCARLADYAAERKINIVIENHGGPSSDPDWLMSVMAAVNKPNFGTLPDFGNFPQHIDRYTAVEKLMAHAKAVSAKAIRFNPAGQVQETDFGRMMRIVRDAGYAGHVGIESVGIGGTPEGEAKAILFTKGILETIRAEQARTKPIFNGRDLTGWRIIEGGDWAVEKGILIGRNGQNWTTDPEKTGSWLRTDKPYANFKLELQYMISPKGNSGVFFRSALKKNPAFTGYEMQIYDGAGQKPSRWGPTALYEVVPPLKNRVRPSGQWNTVTIIAKGPGIKVVVNGEKVIETMQTRSMKGYIGLQNHDAKAVVRFRNIRIQEI